MLRKCASEPNLRIRTILKAVLRTDSESELDRNDYYLHYDSHNVSLHCDLTSRLLNDSENCLKVSLKGNNGNSLALREQDQFVATNADILSVLPKDRVIEVKNAVKQRYEGPGKIVAEPEEDEEHKYVCKSCGLEFESLSRMKRHLNTHLAGSYYCVLCNKQFKHDYNVLDHWKKACPVVKSLGRPVQNYSTEQLKRLVDVANRKLCREESIEYIPPLEEVDKEFALFPLVKYHEADPVKCSRCRLEVPVFHSETHVARHDGHASIDDRCKNNMFACDLCAEFFRYHVDLCNHWRYKCPVVMKRFNEGLKTQSVFTTHLRNIVHDIVRSYGRREVSKHMNLEQNLPSTEIEKSTRKRKHTSWNCLYCAESFQYEMQLSEHLKEDHNGILPVICAFCKSALKYKHNLYAHWRSTCTTLQMITNKRQKTFYQQYLCKRDYEWMAEFAERTSLLVKSEETSWKDRVELLFECTSMKYSDIVYGKKNGDDDYFICRICNKKLLSYHDHFTEHIDILRKNFEEHVRHHMPQVKNDRQKKAGESMNKKGGEFSALPVDDPDVKKLNNFSLPSNECKIVCLFAANRIIEGGITVDKHSHLDSTLRRLHVQPGDSVSILHETEGRKIFLMVACDLFHTHYFLWPKERRKEITWDGLHDYKPFSRAWLGLDRRLHMAYYDEMFVKQTKVIRKLHKSCETAPQVLEEAMRKLDRIKELGDKTKAKMIVPWSDGKYRLPSTQEMIKIGQLAYICDGTGYMSTPLNPEDRIRACAYDGYEVEISCANAIRGNFLQNPLPKEEVVIINGLHDVPIFVKRETAETLRVPFTRTDLRGTGASVPRPITEAVLDESYNVLCEPELRALVRAENVALRADSEPPADDQVEFNMAGRESPVGQNVDLQQQFSDDEEADEEDCEF